MSTATRTRIDCTFPDCPRSFHYDLSECLSASRVGGGASASYVPAGLPQDDDGYESRKLVDAEPTYLDPDFTPLAQPPETEEGRKALHMVFSQSHVGMDLSQCRIDDPTLDLVPADTQVNSRSEAPMWMVGDERYITALAKAHSGNRLALETYRVNRLNDLADGEAEWGREMTAKADSQVERFAGTSDDDLIAKIESKPITTGTNPVLVEFARRQSLGLMEPARLESEVATRVEFDPYQLNVRVRPDEG